ncbi:MAG: hypothetical protein OEM18_07005 [Nitrosopumilus sp.]|nr:hypothetical protein [Nitrosopumilus sp.]
MSEALTDFIMMDVIGSLVQIPAYVLMIGVPVWLTRRWYLKRKAKQNAVI